jgi:hypothetical protein
VFSDTLALVNNQGLGVLLLQYPFLFINAIKIMPSKDVKKFSALELQPAPFFGGNPSLYRGYGVFGAGSIGID